MDLTIKGTGQIAAPTHLDAPAVSDESQYLTPDALLAYCQTRLRQLDTKIQQDMADNKLNVTRQDVASNVSAVLKRSEGQIPQEAKNWQVIKGEAEKYLAQLPSDDAVRQSLEATLNHLGEEMGIHADGTGTLTAPPKEKWQAYEMEIDNMGKDLQKGAELMMIELQDQISARTTAIQLVTQMMQKLDQGLESIAQKI